MAEWAKVAQLTFNETTDQHATRSIVFLFATGEHGDGYPFDGPSKVLAHTFYPAPPNTETIAGDMHFDDAEYWRVGSDIDLFSVALHEMGHALGLGHSDKPTAVMYPYYQRVTTLTDEDKNAILALYAAQVAGPLAVAFDSSPRSLDGSLDYRLERHRNRRGRRCGGALVEQPRRERYRSGRTHLVRSCDPAGHRVEYDYRDGHRHGLKRRHTIVHHPARYRVNARATGPDDALRKSDGSGEHPIHDPGDRLSHDRNHAGDVAHRTGSHRHSHRDYQLVGVDSASGRIEHHHGNRRRRQLLQRGDGGSVDLQ